MYGLVKLKIFILMFYSLRVGCCGLGSFGCGRFLGVYCGDLNGCVSRSGFCIFVVFTMDSSVVFLVLDSSVYFLILVESSVAAVEVIDSVVVFLDSPVIVLVSSVVDARPVMADVKAGSLSIAAIVLAEIVSLVDVSFFSGDFAGAYTETGAAIARVFDG